MDSISNVSEIKQFTEILMNKYLNIRGKEVDKNTFWDAVIISASDDCQMKGYEKQIFDKQQRKELPLNAVFHVFADPPGFKIGCGGSTMFVLDQLSMIYENALYDMRILLIPAGGYSQRLPNLSAPGKLFCHLPFGELCFQMIDLILATYLPFLSEMPPGVFLSSSDAIISYSLNKNDSWTFKNKGFTALAHLSPLSIGVGHGVYVLPSVKLDNSRSAFMSPCLRVLQKPSIEEMRDKKAVVEINSGGSKQEFIFSDSSFFFDHKITQKLVRFYSSNKPLKCELSSYGDFLQPLGSQVSPSYIVEKVTNEGVALKKAALYRDLFGSNFSVLVLKNSVFHHLGTMQEYIDSFCFKNSFSESFPLSKFSFSSWSVNGLVPLYVDGTVIHSVIHPLSCVSEGTVLEYCDINVCMTIGKNCIISNIQASGIFVERLPYKIPNNTLIHTAAVKDGYVTIACSILDDIKRVYPDQSSFELDFFGKRLCSKVCINLQCFSEECDSYSLWNARIFPVLPSRELSLKETLKLMTCKNETELEDLFYQLDEECVTLLSLGDILLHKDAMKMIDYQSSLNHRIKIKRLAN